MTEAWKKSVKKSTMDNKDWQLIRELEADARVPLSVLSRRLGIPRVTLLDRLRALRESRVIRRFTLELDYQQLGQGTTAYVLVRFESVEGITQRSLADQVSRIRGVEEVHIIAGEWDLILKVRGSSLEEIGELVIDHLRGIPGVSASVTLPIFNSVKA